MHGGQISKLLQLHTTCIECLWMNRIEITSTQSTLYLVLQPYSIYWALYQLYCHSFIHKQLLLPPTLGVHAQVVPGEPQDSLVTVVCTRVLCDNVRSELREHVQYHGLLTSVQTQFKAFTCTS